LNPSQVYYKLKHIEQTGEKMPKNPNLNIARYKVAGGELNQFEVHQNQQALVEQQQHEADNLIHGTPPEQKEQPVGGGATATAAVIAPRKTRSK